MIKSNCHTHTVFCDGENTPEEMIKKAIELKFTSLGFSAHSPMCFENDYAALAQNFPIYFNEIERLKKKYVDIIEIYNGVELDSDSIDLSEYKFDYVIASVHQIHKNGKIYSIDYTSEEFCRCVNDEFEGSFMKMAEHYYSEFVKFIIDVKPDVVGHFDLIEKFNNEKQLFDNCSDEYKSIVKKAVETIAEKCPGQIFEINTGAMYRYNNKSPYPSAYIMKLLKEHNMKITINSDSHSVNSLNFAFEEALNYCKEFGYESVYILQNGKFTEKKI